MYTIKIPAATHLLPSWTLPFQTTQLQLCLSTIARCHTMTFQMLLREGEKKRSL